MNIPMILIMAGAILLFVSLISISRLIVVLPAGGLKNGWCALLVMVVAFIAGYLITSFSSPKLLISLLLFFGSVFVLVVSMLSQHVALYAERIVVLEKENVTDSLMKIYNRRYLNVLLKKEIQRSLKIGHPLSVMLIDVDHFKRINDDYGHLTGDEVLRSLGPLIVNSVRQADIVARYGGEEVVVVARDTSSLVATGLAQRICSTISNSSFPTAAAENASHTIQITASIGVATFREGDSMITLTRRADEALYRAKNEGRNRVVVSAPPRNLDSIGDVEVSGSEPQTTVAESF